MQANLPRVPNFRRLSVHLLLPSLAYLSVCVLPVHQVAHASPAILVFGGDATNNPAEARRTVRWELQFKAPLTMINGFIEEVADPGQGAEDFLTDKIKPIVEDINDIENFPLVKEVVISDGPLPNTTQLRIVPNDLVWITRAHLADGANVFDSGFTRTEPSEVHRGPGAAEMQFLPGGPGDFNDVIDWTVTVLDGDLFAVATSQQSIPNDFPADAVAALFFSDLSSQGVPVTLFDTDVPGGAGLSMVTDEHLVFAVSTSGDAGVNVTLTSALLPGVPEPASATLLLIGLAAVLRRHRGMR